MTRVTSQALNESYTGKNVGRGSDCFEKSTNRQRWCGRDVARQVVPGAGSCVNIINNA